MQSFTFIIKGNVDQVFTVEAEGLGEAWEKAVTEFREPLGNAEYGHLQGYANLGEGESRGITLTAPAPCFS
jgi:hypothetical protein